MSAEGEPATLTSRVVRGVGVAGLGYAATQALTLITYVVLARLVTPVEFGQYTAASVILYFGFLFTESGMVAAVIQRRDRVEEAANTALFATLIGGLLFAGVALALAPLIGDFFRSDTVAALVAAFSGLLFLRTTTVAPDAMLERRLSFLRRAVVEPISAIGFGLGAIIAASNGLGVWSFAVGLYAAAFIDTVLSWALARWRPQPRLASLGMWRELMSFGRHVIAAGIVERLGQQGDRLIVGRFIGTAPLGQYGYAYRVATMPYMAILAIAAHVLYPAFASIAEDTQRLLRGHMRALALVMVVAAPSGLFLAALGEAIVVLVFGETWRPGGEAVRYMCLFVTANALLSVNLEAVKALGAPRELVRTHVLMTVATLALMAAAVPLGINGIGAALSVGSLAGAAYATSAFMRLTGSPGDVIVRAAAAPVAAAALATAILLPLEGAVLQASQMPTGPGLAVLALELLAGAAIYLAALRALSPPIFAELRRGAASARGRLRARGPGPGAPA